MERIDRGKEKSCIILFLEQFKDFLVIILIISAIISGILGDAESAAVIFLVITMNAILGTVQTLKAEQSLKSLKQLSAPEAKVVRDHAVIQIPAKEVTIGDEVLIEAGDCIPADGKLIETASLKVDESALTGESLSVEKNLEDVPENAAIGDRTNQVFSGSFVTYGHGRYEVTAIGMNTEMGKIAYLLKNTSEKMTPLQKNLDDFGKKLSIMILILCGILFILSILRGDNILNAFLFAVALAVAAIPEALSSIVTIVLSFGTQKMAKEHAIIRKLQAVEGLGSVSVICSDKTGTLTQNKMTVEDYYIYPKRISVSELNFENDSEKELLISSILCNDGMITDGEQIGDPTETALLAVLQEKKYIEYSFSDVREACPRLSEIPFDSDRKMMSTENKCDGRYVIYVKGAVDVLLKRITHIRKYGSEKPELINEEDRLYIEKQNLEFSREGLRVLAFAYKELDAEKELTLEDENNLVFLGLIAMMDPPRQESKQAVKECIKAGIRPVMITGDHKVTAAAIAKELVLLKMNRRHVKGQLLKKCQMKN